MAAKPKRGIRLDRNLGNVGLMLQGIGGHRSPQAMQNQAGYLNAGFVCIRLRNWTDAVSPPRLTGPRRGQGKRCPSRHERKGTVDQPVEITGRSFRSAGEAASALAS